MFLLQQLFFWVSIFLFLGNESYSDTSIKDILFREKRVVNGSYSDFAQWPFLVSIKNYPLRLFLAKNQTTYMNWTLVGNDSHICGATLISKSWIVSAKHCVEYDGMAFKDNWKAALGAHDLRTKPDTQQIIDIDRVLFFDNSSDSNDIVLMHLSKPAEFTATVKSICVSKGKLNIVNLECIGIGWGSTVSIVENAISPVPKHFKANYINVKDENCLFHVDDPKTICFSPITGVGCRGDSGGPLVCRNKKEEPWKFVGITASGTGCTKMSDRIIYTNVSNFYMFLKPHLDEKWFCKSSSLRFQFGMFSFALFIVIYLNSVV